MFARAQSSSMMYPLNFALKYSLFIFLETCLRVVLMCNV